MNRGDLARLDHETTEAHTDLPHIVQRLCRLDHELWVRPAGDGEPVAVSGHTDPTGQTAIASLGRRQHLTRAADLLLRACASIRGAQVALDKAEGTIDGWDGTQAAADQAAHRTVCSNCRCHAPTRKGRCQACDRWLTRHGTERPEHQWHQHHHGGAP